MRRALHRLLTGSAAGLIAAAVVALPATLASAADSALRLHFPDIAVVPNMAKINPLFAWVDVPGDQHRAPVQIGKLTVSVDTAGVSEIATVEAAGDIEVADDESCSRTGTVITCTITGPLVLDAGPNLLPLLALKVTGKSGAAPEASGKLTFTARADADPVVTAESTVTIGEGVDVAGFITEPSSVAAGATVTTDLRVANVGAKPVHGVVLAMLGWDPSLVAGEGFSNCTYGILTVCTFDDELATGSTYELSTPMRLRIPSDAAAGSRASALGSWFTPSDFKELLDIVPDSTDSEILGPKGTGPAVRLQAVPVKRSASRAAGSQVDTNPGNNVLISEVVVAGNREPDVAAVGATVSGTAGDRVGARVGFVNNGPGTLYHWTFENTDPATHVTVPPGLRVVKVDDRCFPVPSAITDPDDADESDGENEDEDVTGAADYLCTMDGGTTKAKASTLFDFTFEVRADASDAPGQVRINEEVFTGGDALDADDSDNSAKIEVSLSGGTGGGLPVTGANAGLLGAAGAALLVAGALGLRLARRRRTRFTA